MAYDGIITKGIALELSAALSGGKIEKIYQPQSEELTFHIHSHSGNFKLYVSCDSSRAGAYFIKENIPNPPEPRTFCMLLRKHMSGGRIIEISQRDCERILEISVATINELGFSVNKKLIIEIMGKHSNIILTDIETGKIVDCIKRVSIDVNRVRQLLPGIIYEYPPSQDKIPYISVTPEDLEGICTGSPETLSLELLSHIQGISPAISRELWSDRDTSEFLSSGKTWNSSICTQKIYERLCNIRDSINGGKFYPVVYLNSEHIPVDFHATPISDLELVCQVEAFDTISEAIEYYFKNKGSANRLKQKTMDLEKALKANLNKLYTKKQKIAEEILKAENSEELRLFGELLTTNLHLFKSGDSSVRLLNYYNNTEISISLDKKLSPSKNAQQYFKRYGKSKTAIKEKNAQLMEADGEIEYLESVYSFLEAISTDLEIEEIRRELVESGYLRKKKSYGKAQKIKPAPYNYITSSGFKVLVGRNNTENDILTFKTAGKNDIWFHTKDIPGSHVILFTEDKKPEAQDIYDAAGYAAYHSKGKGSENVPVDYVNVRYVKKPSGAKPGMVIFTNNKTVYVNPKTPVTL